jgi:hypothetical protein
MMETTMPIALQEAKLCQLSPPSSDAYAPHVEARAAYRNFSIYCLVIDADIFML